MAMVENIIYDSAGVNIIGSNVDEQDDRDTKMMIFRALVGPQSDAEKQAVSTLLASFNDGIAEPVGLDDHLPPPFLETNAELPSASTVFDDMGGNKNKHTDAQETFDRLTKEKEEFLQELKTNEPKETPAAFDTFKDNEETVETVYEKSKGSTTTSWFIPASTRQSTRDRLAEFPETMLDQSSQKYTAIKVFQSKDEYDRTFFMLDDGIRQHLMLVLFEVNDQQMLSINDVVMPLEYFLNSSQAMETEEDKAEARKEGRPIVRIRIGHELLEIPDTSVPMIMMALTVLNRYQKCQTVNTENKIDSKEDALSWTKWLTGAVVFGAAIALKIATASRF